MRWVIILFPDEVVIHLMEHVHEIIKEFDIFGTIGPLSSLEHSFNCVSIILANC